MKEKFKRLEELNVINGLKIDMNSYNDCRRELQDISKKYAEIIDSGVKLNKDALDEFHRLTSNCLRILDMASDEALLERKIDARIANTFLEDKYNLN